MIRLATINDINSLVELRIKLLSEANINIINYDWSRYSEVLRTFYHDGISSGRVIAYVAEENKNIIATSIMCFYNITPLLYNLDGKMALLSDMYTTPEYRSKGLGTSLLNSIMEHTRELGYKKIILNATESGRKLYEKYGFKDINGEMSYKFV
jgi:GNAT superfamily N-acetyltransferase